MMLAAWHHALSPTLQHLSNLAVKHFSVSHHLARPPAPTRAAPRQVNKDPFGDGWMVKLRLSDPAQVESLMDAKAYEQKCSSDDH